MDNDEVFSVWVRKDEKDVGLIMVEAHGYKAGDKVRQRDIEDLTFFGKAWEDMTRETPDPGPNPDPHTILPGGPDTEFTEDAMGFSFTLIGDMPDLSLSCGAAMVVEETGWEETLQEDMGELTRWATERMAHGFARFVVKCHYQVDQTGGYMDVEPEYDGYIAIDGIVDMRKIVAEPEKTVAQAPALAKEDENAF